MPVAFHTWRLAAVLAAVLGAACSRSDPTPAPAPAPSEPWPAQARSSGQRSQRVAYAVAKRGEVSFDLKTRQAQHRGVMGVARGELEIDLLDLSASRGHVEVDLTSVRMLDEDGEPDRQASARALNWFELGSSRPPAGRERFRWARFVIESVSDTSSEAAHEGRLQPAPKPAADAGAGGSSGQQPAQIRIVDLTMKGKLRLHDYEVVQVVALRAAFHYAAPATAGAVPQQIVLTTRRSFPVGLAAHDIRPRDALGTEIASDMKLLGTEVAREARVTLHLEATPKQ